MVTSIRIQDYTQAAARAIRDALLLNSLKVAEAFDLPREAMRIQVQIGVQRPGTVAAVVQPKLTICAVVMRAPNKPTPKSKTLREQNSMPGLALASALR